MFIGEAVRESFVPRAHCSFALQGVLPERCLLYPNSVPARRVRYRDCEMASSGQEVHEHWDEPIWKSFPRCPCFVFSLAELCRKSAPCHIRLRQFVVPLLNRHCPACYAAQASPDRKVLQVCGPREIRTVATTTFFAQLPINGKYRKIHKSQKLGKSPAYLCN